MFNKWCINTLLALKCCQAVTQLQQQIVVAMEQFSLFNLLDDDVLLQLLYGLAQMDTALEGSEWQTRRMQTARDVYALSGSCARLRKVLVTTGALLHTEMRARAATDVCPTVKLGIYPYTDQRAREKAATRKVKVMRSCETAMTFHCASKHCSAARRDACRGHDMTITPIEKSRVNMMSSAPDADLCYASVHLDTRSAARNVIRLFSATGAILNETNVPENADGDPLFMSASPDGTRMAYIVPIDELSDDNDGVSERLFLWTAFGTDSIASSASMPAPMVANEGVMWSAPPVQHPQAVWWMDATTLVVAWSTTFVHPSGQSVAGSVVSHDERYVFCTYDVSDGMLEYTEAEGPFFGRLMSASATRSGDRVAALVRQRPMRTHESHYRAVVHYKGADVALRHPAVWKGRGKHGSDGFDWGPSAVGISPVGDVVVCMHRTLGSVIVEVHVLDRGAEYVATNSRDLTPWLSRSDLHEDDFMRLWHEQEDEEDDGEDLPNKVKIPYTVGFSSCGSFSAIVDRRPIHGSRAPHFSTVLLNVSKRRTQRDLKAVPLFRERHSIAKALEWRDCGIWVQSRRGAVLLRSC